jgi:serine phosphatase RsbU (regulator of sigma subunit)
MSTNQAYEQAQFKKSQLSFWQKRSLAAKIVSLSVFVSFTVCVFSLAFILSSYKSEKIAHLYEMHAQQTSSLTEHVRSLLSSQVMRGEGVTQFNPKISLGSEARTPSPGEISWMKKGNLSSLVFKVSAGLLNIPMDPSAFSKQLSEYLDLPFAITDSEGQTLAVNGLSPAQISELLSYASRSGLSKSQSVIEIWGQKQVLSYAEIPKTNLIMISARPVGDVLLPVRKKIWLWLSLCAFFFFWGSLAQRWVIRALSKPLRDLTCFFDEIVANKRPMALQSTIPELSSVMSGAQIMIGAIDTRQLKLNYIIDGQKKILLFTQQAQGFDQLTDICLLFVDLVLKLTPYGKAYCWHFNFPELTHNWFRFNENAVTLLPHLQLNHFAEQLTGFLDTLIAPQQNHDAIEVLDLSPLNIKLSMGLRFSLGGLAKDRFELFIGFENQAVRNRGEEIQQAEFSELLNLAADGLKSALIRRSLSTLEVAESIAKRELEYASKVHEKCIFVANDLPTNIHLSTLVRPASVVGGDWLAVYSHSNIGLVNFYIGDVTGHGLDSAFLVSLVSGAVKMAERELEKGHLALPTDRSFLATRYLSDLYSNLDMLMRDASDSKQMTFAAGIIDTHNGRLYFLNAGHLPPMRFGHSTGGTTKSLLSVQNGPLGSGSPHNEIEVKIEDLDAGETLFLYSDGLFENLAVPDRPNHKTRYNAISELLTSKTNNIGQLAQEVFDWTLTLARKETNTTTVSSKDDVTVLAIRYEKMS